ncbi:uncharacterized protein LOC113331074 isoform X2 [Papaver somniferum]|uniref:uncharacterized protein LOC113331074 isoform X2 n=1 Tax=Papaver somniferum TaxID=3469 RepID=UPI000E704585|nr:uncharacterized protein LOC113331074 isoform X2 [Papaver somniferum]
MIMRPIFCARFEEILNISSLSMGLGTVDRVDMKYGRWTACVGFFGALIETICFPCTTTLRNQKFKCVFIMKAYGTISEMDSGDNDIHVSFYYNRETDHR